MRFKCNFEPELLQELEQKTNYISIKEGGNILNIRQIV